MIGQLRIITLNLHKGLSQFNRRMVIHELREGLRSLSPDLVFLQEVMGQNERYSHRFAAWPRVPQYEFLAEEGWQHAYGRNANYAHGHHGNAVLSRFRILSSLNEDVSNHRYERRGLLHCEVAVPGWPLNLHCLCVHLSLHERGRRKQLDTIAERVEDIVARGLPLIVAGDFNDWRQRASSTLERGLGMREVSITRGGRAARTFPSVFPLLRLDRIYVRGFDVISAQAHRGAPWSLLSDHLALSADLKRT